MVESSGRHSFFGVASENVAGSLGPGQYLRPAPTPNSSNFAFSKLGRVDWYPDASEEAEDIPNTLVGSVRNEGRKEKKTKKTDGWREPWERNACMGDPKGRKGPRKITEGNVLQPFPEGEAGQGRRKTNPSVRTPSSDRARSIHPVAAALSGRRAP